MPQADSKTEQAVTHTPGPWSCGAAPDTQWVVKSTEQWIANTLHGNDEANARLIAAAPDLLNALKTILEGFDSGVFVRDVTRDADNSWAVRLLPFITALRRAQIAIQKAEER